MNMLLRLRDVQTRIPRSRSTLYSEVKRGLFPEQVKVGSGSFWLQGDIEEMLAAYAGGAGQSDLRELCLALKARRRGGSSPAAP